MNGASISAVADRKQRGRSDLIDSLPPRTGKTDEQRHVHIGSNTKRGARRDDSVDTGRKRRARGDLSDSPPPENDETESERRRRLSHNRHRRVRRRYRVVTDAAKIGLAGSGETAAVRGNGDIADHELLQNDYATTIGNAHRNSDVTDSSRHHPIDRERKMRLGHADGSNEMADRHRRFDRERKRRQRNSQQGNRNSDLANERRRLDRERKRRLRKAQQGNRELIDRSRRIHWERQQRYRERNPIRQVNFQKRLKPVNVKPTKIYMYCNNNFLLYAHESA